LIWFEDLRGVDVARVGARNCMFGEMVRDLSERGVSVPPGFVTTAEAYWQFLDTNDLRDTIAMALKHLASGRATLAEVGRVIRREILWGHRPAEIADGIMAAYHELGRKCAHCEVDVAVRSSATAGDLPDASFAGQQETLLNICGSDALLDAVTHCYASLFADRAVADRQAKGIDHLKVALSVGVQRMVRSDLGGAGVMVVSSDSGAAFKDVVMINAAWGLAENVIQGAVDPDEYRVFDPLLGAPERVPVVARKLGTKAQKMIYAAEGEPKTRNVPTSLRERASFVLSEEENIKLARWAALIERRYGYPMHMEWAKDGETGELFIVRSRPETVSPREVRPGSVPIAAVSTAPA
jgi:pyruvate,water dikinase